MPSVANADHHSESADRSGFIAGFGLGLGVASIVADAGERRTRFGVTTTVGYGITPKLAAYLMSRIVCYRLDGGITFSETAGARVSYFLADSVPSL